MELLTINFSIESILSYFFPLIEERCYTIGCCFCLSSANREGENENCESNQIEDMKETIEKIQNILHGMHLKPLEKCFSSRFCFWVTSPKHNKKLYLTVDMKNVMEELEKIESDVLYSQDKGLRQRIDALNKFLTDIEQKIDNATNECFSYISTEHEC